MVNHRQDVRRISLEQLESRLMLSAVIWTETGVDGVEYEYEGHYITEQEVSAMRERYGVAEEGRDYNVIIDGHGTGLRPPTEEEWARMVGSTLIVDRVSALAPEGGEAAGGGPGQPPSVDWIGSQYLPPIGNQDGEGSCTAWAVGYYTKTFQEAQEHGWDFSGADWVGGYYGEPTPAYQDQIFSPDFLYHLINLGMDIGSWAFEAIGVINDIGAATWSTMPYDPADHSTWPSEAAWREAPLYRGDGTGTHYLDLTSSLDGLKNLLAGGNLAQISVDADYIGDSIEVSTTDNYGYLGVSTNHCVTVVGYDDAFEYTEEGETRQGAFKILNSWGDDWNDDGWWWMSYETMMEYVEEASYFNDAVGYEPEVVAVFNIDHEVRGDTVLYFGTGDPGSPTSEKAFWYGWDSDATWDGIPYPSHDIVVDITELTHDIDNGTMFYMGFSDTLWSDATGTLESFTIEAYSDYAGDVLIGSWSSDDTPLDTINNDIVYAIVAAGDFAPTVEDISIEPLTLNKIIEIEVTFSEDMAGATLNDLGNYSLVEDGGPAVSIDSVDADSDSVVLAINGGVPIESGDFIFTIVSGGLEDLDGKALDGDGDGTAGDDYILSFTVKDVGYMAATVQTFGGTVCLYDTDALTDDEIDVRDNAIIRGNSRVGITQVILQPQYSTFGVVIKQKAGSTQPIAVIDNTFAPIDISYIVVDGNVSKIVLHSDVAGKDINGVTFPCTVAVDADSDGDGETDDLIGILTTGSGRGDAGVIVSHGMLNGETVIGGSLMKLVATRAGAGVCGELFVEDDLGYLLLGDNDLDESVTTQWGGITLIKTAGSINAPVTAENGQILKVIALGGTGVNGDITVGDGMYLFLARDDVAGDFDVNGDFVKFILKNGDFSGDLEIDNGDLTLLKVVNGSIAEIDVDGDAAKIIVIGTSEATDAISDDIDIEGTLGFFMLKRGVFDGDLEAGDMGRIYYYTTNGITEDVESERDVVLLKSLGPISGDVDIERHAHAIYALGGVLGGGDIVVGGILAGSGATKILVVGNLLGEVDIVGGLERCIVKGNVNGGDVTVDGLLELFLVTGNFTSSDITADELARVLVKGTVSGLGEIRALTGDFDFLAGRDRYLIDDPTGETIDNIHAYVC